MTLREPSAVTGASVRSLSEPVPDDVTSGDAGGGNGVRRPRLRTVHPVAVAAILYVALGFVAFWQAWSGGATHTMTCDCFDPAQSVWFLAWQPFSLLHGHNPLLTTWLNPSQGVNLMDNASMPLLGLLTAPVTLLAGPVASWNVIALLALSGSALCAFCVFRRYARWWPAAFVGGLAFGFGPYVTTQGPSHINLSLAVFPPLVLWLLDSIVVRRRGSPYRWGAALGLASTAQLLVSAEILVTTVMMACVGLTALAAAHAHGLRERILAERQWALRTMTSAVTAFAVTAWYPVWMAVAGPLSLRGGETSHPEALSANLLGFVLPSENQLFTVGATRHLVDPSFVGGFLSENTTFVGIPMLIAVGVASVLLWRLSVVKVATSITVAAAVLSLGPDLLVGTHAFGAVVLPYWVLLHLPVLQNVIPTRLALFVDLGSALVLAVAMDRVHGVVLRRASRRRDGPGAWVKGRALAAIAPLAVAVAALVPQVPRWPYAMQQVGMPSYFTSPAVRRIPAGSIVDVYPFPRVTHAQAMLWQAESGMRFRMLGGFVLTAGPHRMGTEFPRRRETTEIWFGSTYWLGGPFTVLPSAVAGVRRDLRVHDVETVIIAEVGRDPEGARALVTAALGRPPETQGGVWVWYGVQRQLRSQPG